MNYEQANLDVAKAYGALSSIKAAQAHLERLATPPPKWLVKNLEDARVRVDALIAPLIIRRNELR